MRLRIGVCILVLPATAQARSQAEAQAPAAPPPAKPASSPPATVEGITVHGAAPPVRVGIDRKSYDVAHDLQATTGSIGDALRNIPSVDVDVQGNVAIRGDSSVTILIDGRASAVFQGQGKAQALQSLPASQIERVEVLTNPSAEFNPDGSGGIINLITKKSHVRGPSAQAAVTIGSEARRGVTASGAYGGDRITMKADAATRRDVFKQTTRDDRTASAALGQPSETEDTSSRRDVVRVRTAHAGADYALDKASHVGLDLNYVAFRFENPTLELLRGGASPGDELIYERSGPISRDRETLGATASYRRSFGKDHSLDVDLTRERTREDRGRQITTEILSPGGIL